MRGFVTFLLIAAVVLTIANIVLRIVRRKRNK